MDFDGSRSVAASGDAVWQVVSDAGRLADWLPTVAAARAKAAESVELEGESHGHPYKVTSPWRTNEATRTLEWGDSAGDGYRGSLRVVGQASEPAQVQVHVSVPDERVTSSPEGEAVIRRGMEEALDRLSALAAR